MEVLIKNKRFNWKSNFINEINDVKQNIWAKKRDDYFSTTSIGGTKCFIKRSENGFQGATIFKALLGGAHESIPNIYCYSEVVENNKKVQYLITEFIDGDTLDVVMNNGVDLDLTKIANNLLSAVNFLNTLGYWHSDLNADNIFISYSGRAYLIDIDSCVENSIKPTHISNQPGALTTLSNQLGSHALKYYKEYLGKSSSFNYSNISGANLNYFQIIFLIYQLKYFETNKTKNPSLFWKKSTFKGLNIAEEVRKSNPNFADSVFKVGLLKSIHKDVVLNLIKDITNTSGIPASPSLALTKEKKDLAHLQVKNDQLQNAISSYNGEKKRLLKEIDRLKSEPKIIPKNYNSNNWTYFWAVGMVISSIIGLFCYNDLNKITEDCHVQHLNETYKVNALNVLVDEIQNKVEPFHFKNATFYNKKTGSTEISFKKSQLTYVAPRLSIFSLIDNKTVEVRYTCLTPFLTYNVYNELKYVREEIKLTRGLNKIEFSSTWGSDQSGHWALGAYKYKFYVDGNEIGEQILSVK